MCFVFFVISHLLCLLYSVCFIWNLPIYFLNLNGLPYCMGRWWLSGQSAGAVSLRTRVQVTPVATRWRFSVIAEWPMSFHMLSWWSSVHPDAGKTLKRIKMSSGGLHEPRKKSAIMKYSPAQLTGLGGPTGHIKKAYWRCRPSVKEKVYFYCFMYLLQRLFA